VVTTNGTAAGRWAEALAAWAIPEEILAAAPEGPWSFPPELFARMAERALAEPVPTPTRRQAAAAVPEGGVVLDVGAGGGAASLPLAPPAGRLVAVDQSRDMLEHFARGARARDVDHEEIQGSWPDVAAEVEQADVVVCHHVVYNVADLVPFVEALSAHARRRVVLEMTARHPQTSTNPLWLELHGVVRPSTPGAGDAVAVLEEMGLEVAWEPFERPAADDDDDLADVVAFLRRQLCVGPDRDGDIEALVRHHGREPLRQAVAVWWDVG